MTGSKWLLLTTETHLEAVRDVQHYLLPHSVMRSPGQNFAKLISISLLKAGHLNHEQSEGRLQHKAPRSQEIKPPLASVKEFLLKEKHRERATRFKHPSSAAAGATTLAPKSQRSVEPQLPGQSRM